MNFKAMCVLHIIIHHPANGFALVLLRLCGMLMVGLSDWVEYNFGQMIPYLASTAGREGPGCGISIGSLHVRTSWCNMHRDLKPDGQRRGSHQDDQGDCQCSDK